jgi:hypothetical protein
MMHRVSGCSVSLPTVATGCLRGAVVGQQADTGPVVLLLTHQVSIEIALDFTTRVTVKGSTEKHPYALTSAGDLPELSSDLLGRPYRAGTWIGLNRQVSPKTIMS